MSFQNLDQVEEAINLELAKFPEPIYLPIIDPDNQVVGHRPPSRSFYGIFSRESFPDIFEGLRGTVILMIGETHVRLFRKLDETMEFMRGLKTPCRLIGGPPLKDMTLEELEGRE